jgi:hypothetical protein
MSPLASGVELMQELGVGREEFKTNAMTIKLIEVDKKKWGPAEV